MTAATYHDGRTSQGTPASVRIDDDALVIASDDGRVLDRWPRPDVRLVDRPRPGAPPRLRLGGGDARLTLADDAEFAAIEAACPNLRKPVKGDGGWRPVVLWGGAAVVSVVLLVWVLIPAFAGWAAAAFPPGLERRLGDRVAEQIVTVFAAGNGAPVCAGSGGQAALDRVAGRLAAGTELAFPVRVQVVRSPVVNALALPGGQVLVFDGLIDFADDANEVAAVLAHEIAHVAHRHVMEVAVERTAVAVLIGLLVGDVFGGAAIGAVGEALIAGAYTREAEAEADALGVELMNRAGYDARPLADFLDRVADEHGEMEGVLGYFASHPASAERAQAVRAAVVGGGPAMTAEEWTAMQAMCD